MDSFKKYKRFPIQLSPNNIMMIHLWKMEDNFQKMEIMDDEGVWEVDFETHRLASKQLFDQLEGHYCDAFLEGIILEATKLLIKSDNFRLNSSKPEDREKIDYRAQKALDKAKELLK